VQREYETPSNWRRNVDVARPFVQLPLTLGVKIGNDRAFEGLLRWNAWREEFGPWQTEMKEYKKVPIWKLRFPPDSKFSTRVNDVLGTEDGPHAKEVEPILYTGEVEGVWYVGSSEKALHDRIDLVEARKKGDAQKGERVDTNFSLYLAPSAAVEARPALRAYLEWETHRRAVANTTLWHALYRSGVLAPDADDKTMRATAQHWFGFVPVSPDDSEYMFDRTGAEVVNVRHGSVHRPRLHDDLAAKSPLATLLDQVRTIRADLRFREDGVHTTLTLERKGTGR
jgi:hypothetical protein